MVAMTRTPSGRLALALMTSCVLHALLLFPLAWPSHQPSSRPVLTVDLPEPGHVRALATQPEPEIPPEPSPPPPVAAPSAPSLRPQPLRGRALDTALAALTREEFYPREAIARGLEGRVVLLLTLDAAGAVTGIEVASGSGHALLDDAALRAATRIGRLPGSRRQVLLPVEFRLE